MGRVARSMVGAWWSLSWPLRLGFALFVIVAVSQYWRHLVGAAVVLLVVRAAWSHRHAIPRLPLPQRLWSMNRLLVRWRWTQAARATGLVGPQNAPPEKQRPPAVRVSRTRTGWSLAFSPPRGMAPDDVQRAAGAVASAYGVPASIAGTLDVEITLRVRDPLKANVPISEVPAASADLDGGIPVAVSEAREVLTLQQAHTLVVGATGSGKGSVIWAVVRALVVAAALGLVRFIGLDSKASEVRQAEGLFCDYAYTPDEHARVLKGLVELVDRRGEVHTGREFVPTKGEPLVVVVIDEISSLASTFTDSKQRNAALSHLRIVLSLGRSRGVLVVGAGQDPTKEAMPLRSLFPQAVALRLRDVTEARVALGEAAAEAGAEPHRIPIASRSNGYVSAGVGYVQDEVGTLVRCRFPYTSDADLAALVKQLGDHTEHGCAAERRVTAEAANE